MTGCTGDCPSEDRAGCAHRASASAERHVLKDLAASVAGGRKLGEHICVSRRRVCRVERLRPGSVSMSVSCHCHCHCGHSRKKRPCRNYRQNRFLPQSGRRDLNPGPPEPHSGALPDCATPRCTGAKIRECAGDRYHAGLRPPHLSCTLWSLVRVGQSRSAASAGTQCSESPGAP